MPVPPLTLDAFSRALVTHEPRTIPSAVAPRRAAVAVLLRWEREAPDVLLMQRVLRDGDRWSGHVSFPGGMASRGDADLLDTAIRETEEEVGVDLRACSRIIGRCDDQIAMARGKVLPMAITPFVFVQTSTPTLSLGPEAESALWLPLDQAASGELDADYEYRLGPVPLKLPSWRFDGYTVWGLTHGMLARLLAVVAEMADAR